MTYLPRWLAILLTTALLSLATACGDSEETVDAGSNPDAAPAQDAQPAPDATVVPDTGLRLDTGVTPDAGESPDTGATPDAGEPEDSGAEDAGAECPTGYTGPTCEDCATGYQDENDDGTCELACDATGDDALDCGAQGACEVDVQTGLRGCACTAGWAGDLCDECAPGWVLEGAACEPELAVTTGLRLWYDASGSNVIVNANGEVTSWTSRADSFVLVSPAGARPRLDPGAINGRNAVLYDAADQRVASTGTTDALAGEDYTIFAVAFPSVEEAGRAVISSRTGTNYAAFLESTQTGYRFIHRSPAGTTGGDSVTATRPGLVPQLFRVVRAGSGQIRVQQLSVIDQGAFPANPTSTVLTTNAVGASHAFVVGGGPLASFRGHIAEVLVYDRVLTANETSSVRDYVQRKWGF